LTTRPTPRFSSDTILTVTDIAASITNNQNKMAHIKSELDACLETSQMQLNHTHRDVQNILETPRVVNNNDKNLKSMLQDQVSLLIFQHCPVFGLNPTLRLLHWSDLCLYDIELC
jgi:hypothetical protein